MTLADLEADPGGRRPGTPAARLRATALEVIADELPAERQNIERTVARYLRGELSPPPAPADSRPPAEQAAAAAAALSARGHRLPLIMATYPGFHPNPYGSLMELAYEASGLAAVHVADAGAIEEVIANQHEGAYRAVVHVNAPDRFVGRVTSETDAARTAAATLRTLDAWLDRGAAIVASLHNGPRLAGHRASAERAIAQGIVDRARVVHLLSASTPRLLADWIVLDPGRCVHVPHPNYDGVYGPLPSPGAARARYGIPAVDPAPLVVGLIGSLANRKGGLELLDALSQVPETLPSGRQVRLLMAGVPVGSRAEDLIRRALAERRVVARLGYIDDDEVPWLLAALDVAVVAYGQLINSGWLHLALTAGIPAIAPARSTAEEIVQPAALRTFAADDPAALAAALAAAEELLSPVARRAARRSVEHLDARQLSQQFVDAVLAATEHVESRLVGVEE